MIKRLKAGAAVLVVVLLGGCVVSNPGETVIAYLQVHNTHDVDSAMMFWADSASYRVVPDFSTAGINNIREVEAWNAALHSELTGSGYQVKGDTVWFTMTEKNDWYEAAGLEVHTYTDVRVVARQGKMVNFLITRDPQLGREEGELTAHVLEWARLHGYQEDLVILAPEGTFVRTPESAPVFVRLTERYMTESGVEVDSTSL